MEHMDTDRSDAEVIEDCRMTAVGLLFEVTRTIECQIAPQLAEHGLTTVEAGVVVRLSRSPGRRLRMSDLAAHTALSNSGLTRIVDRLERAGLVRREAGASDRRVTFAVLTPGGADKVAALLPGHLEQIEQIFTGVLTTGEADAFLAVLRKIRDQGGQPAATGDPSPAARSA
jgi:DNA-binding MarR family transcriptional regulator